MAVISAALAVWRLATVILLAFGAVLLALLLRGLAGALSRGARIPESWAIVPVMLAALAAIGSVFWLFGSHIAIQFDRLAEDLPQGLASLGRDLGATTLGAWFLGQAQDVNVMGATGQVASRLAALFGSIFRSIAYLAVLLFASFYLAAQPERYRLGLLRLAPPNQRERAGEVLDLMGATLRRWIIGQCITMTVVGTLTGLGLWALGIGAPVALGMIAGTFAFVPYVGPVLAAVPGILMGATQGAVPALYALAVYGGVHFIEGYLITPLVQAEAVRLPPALTIFATVALGVLLGPAGVLLAAPLTVVLLTAVNTFYLEDVLGERRTWPFLGDGGDDT